MLSVEFPNTVNGSAVHYPPIAMLCPGDPELQALSPGAHSFRGKICRYLNSQLQYCVLSVLREGQTRCCGEVDLGDWSRSDRCQGPVRPRERGKGTLVEGTAWAKAWNHECTLCMQGGQHGSDMWDGGHGREMRLKRKVTWGHERDSDFMLWAGRKWEEHVSFLNG